MYKESGVESSHQYSPVAIGHAGGVSRAGSTSKGTNAAQDRLAAPGGGLAHSPHMADHRRLCRLTVRCGTLLTWMKVPDLTRSRWLKSFGKP